MSRSRSVSPSSSTSNVRHLASPGQGSIAAASPMASQRAHGWFGQIEQAWAKREEADQTNEPISRACESIMLERTSVHEGVLHAHAHPLVKIVEEAIPLWVASTSNLPTPAIPAAPAANIDSATPGSAPSAEALAAAAPSASAAATPAPRPPFRLSPQTFYSLLRVLILMCERLPGFYSNAWSASLSKTSPIPLPKGLELEVYQSWFSRIRITGQQLMEECLCDTRHRHIWDPRIVISGCHLSVLAVCHCPSTPMADGLELDRLESALMRKDHWFPMQLPQYDQISSLLSCLASILASAGIPRLASVALKIHRCYSFHPPAVPSTPHSPEFRVQAIPPGLTQHLALRTFVAQVVATAVTEGKRAEQESVQQDDERHPPAESKQSQITKFIHSLIEDAAHLFDSCTSSSTPSPPLHRSIFPLFALCGFLDAVDPTGTAVVESESEEGFAIQKLARMVRFLLTTPDVGAFLDGTQSSSHHFWPCSTHYHSCCGSCLFVVLTSTAIVHSSRWMEQILNQSNADRRAGKREQLDVQAKGSHIFITNTTFLTARMFLHLIDVTWVLNGSILPSEAQPSKTELPRLAAWIGSPVYALVPQYTRALSTFFLLLPNPKSDGIPLLQMMWKRVKYVHEVWRWYAVYGSLSMPTRGSDALSQSSSSISLPSASTSSHLSSPLRLNPVRLKRATLQRAHSSLFMSMAMFLSTIIRDSRFRGSAGVPSVEEMGSHSKSKIELPAASKQHAFTMALILDLVSLLEFAASPLQDSFTPYKELIEILQALLMGREVIAAPSPTTKAQMTGGSSLAGASSDPPLSPHGSLYRAAFAREMITIYLRCFFLRDEPKPQKFLGLENQREHLTVVSATPQRIMLPFLLALSGLPFSPVLRSSITLPDAPTLDWNFDVRALEFQPPLVTNGESADTVAEAKASFRCATLSPILYSLPFPLIYQFILPWCAPLTGSMNLTLNRKAQQLLVICVQRIYRVATRGDKKEYPLDASTLRCPLASVSPGPPPEELEKFARQLTVYLIHRSLKRYPSDGTNFKSLLDTCMNLFSCLPSQDFVHLELLDAILQRAWQQLEELLQNGSRLKRWRQVTELAHDDLESLIGQGGDSEEEELDSDSAIVPLPKNVRLPSKFPSLTAVRRLLLLHLQLLQSLDAPLFSLALGQVGDLFARLDPRVYPLATPIRASLATMVHSSIVRGFDLSKRDATADWYVKMIEQMKIPISIKASEITPITTSTIRNIEALKEAAARAIQQRERAN